MSVGDGVRTHASLIALLCAAFVAVGGGLASLGPTLPELAETMDVPVSSMGVLFSALFAGMLGAQTVSGLIVEHRGTRRLALASMVIFAIGAAVVPTASRLWVLLAGSAVMGIGYGSSTIAINLVASRLLPSRPAFVINLCNVCYGAGAVLGPLLASALLRHGRQARWVPLVCGALLLALLPWALRVLPADGRPRSTDHASARAWHLPTPLRYIALLILLYGGIEAGFGGWVATYVERTLGVPPARAALLTSLYWLSYLAGRVTSTALSLRVGPERVLHGSLIGLMLGGIVLAVSVTHGAGTTLAIVMLGASTGPIYPSMFGVVTARFPERAAFAVSAVSALGSIGAIVLPWGMGLTLPIAGGHVLAAIPLVLAVGMWIAFWRSERTIGDRGSRIADRM